VDSVPLVELLRFTQLERQSIAIDVCSLLASVASVETF
jgi:hypothetical protein